MVFEVPLSFHNIQSRDSSNFFTIRFCLKQTVTFTIAKNYLLNKKTRLKIQIVKKSKESVHEYGFPSIGTVKKERMFKTAEYYVYFEHLKIKKTTSIKKCVLSNFGSYRPILVL